MSRNIVSGAHSFTEEDKKLQNTRDGKLLFTKVRDKSCALFIQNDRLRAARVLSQEQGEIGAIYIGKVKNVAKNINACFVEIANREICFLPMQKTEGAYLLNRVSDGRILEGDEFPVQLIREAQKTKQATVTAQISLSNDAFAISLGKPGIGYSGRLSQSEKEALQQFVQEYAIADKLQESIGLVVRTNAGKLTAAKLLESFHEITTDWVSLIQKASHSTCFTCIKEAPMAFESVLDQQVSAEEYSEILTDSKKLYQELAAYTSRHFPDKKVRLYEEAFPLTKLYSLETKLDSALNTRVWLKCGGYLIIEPTEAMTVIDVNSGKYEAEKGNAEAIYKVNREAAEEIALQLRLRNLSGIIIVDFINMKSREKQEELLAFLRRIVQNDRTKTTVVDMTPLGLVEITRKKENKPLREQFGIFS